MINQQVGNNLRYLRHQERKSMEQMGKLLGLAKIKIANIEKGMRIDLDAIVKIADFFEVSLDNLIRTDLSIKETDKPKIRTVLDTDVSKREPRVDQIGLDRTKPDQTGLTNVPESEPLVSAEDTIEIGKALDCAKRFKFNCYFFNEKKIQFDYCKTCFNAEFWKKKDIAIDVMDTKVEEVKPTGDTYLECDFFQMNPIANCYLRNIQRASLPKCHDCLRDTNRWGNLAIGYDKRSS